METRRIHRQVNRTGRKSEYVIQTVMPDGFTYWWGGIQVMRVPGAKQDIKGSKWTPYWDDTIKFPRKTLAEEAIRICNLEGCEILTDKKADYHLAFDLEPGRLTLYMKYESEKRKEFASNTKDADGDPSF